MQGQSLTPHVIGNIYTIEAEGSIDKKCMILTGKSGKQSHQVGSTFTARREQRLERGYMNALRRIPVTVEQQPRKCGLWREENKLAYREDREDPSFATCRTVSSVSSG